MKYSFTLILAGLALSSLSSFGAVIDLANLGGSFPSYVDNNGIPGLKIDYVVGDSVGTTENRGWSADTGGMSLVGAHLAVGPGDTVTFDFSAVAGSPTVTVAFIDLDNNAIGGDEGLTLTDAGGSQRVEGSPNQIDNSRAFQASNIINVQNLTPDGSGKIVVKADGAIDQGALGNGFFAVQVSTDGVVIPEPSAAFLGLAGLGLLALRRRRHA